MNNEHKYFTIANQDNEECVKMCDIGSSKEDHIPCVIQFDAQWETIENGFSYHYLTLCSSALGPKKINNTQSNYISCCNQNGKVTFKGIINNITYDEQVTTLRISHIHAHRLQGVLSKAFSMGCRAEFGDQTCKFRGDKYVEVDILNIFAPNKIELGMLPDRISAYINGMKAIIFCQNNSIESIATKVVDFDGSYLYITDSITDYIGKKSAKLRLEYFCDKKYKTCLQLFNNIVNFQGEPLTDYHTLKEFIYEK